MCSAQSSFPSGPSHGREPKHGSSRPYVAFSFSEAPHAHRMRMSLKSPVGPSWKVSDGAGQRSEPEHHERDKCTTAASGRGPRFRLPKTKLARNAFVASKSQVAGG